MKVPKTMKKHCPRCNKHEQFKVSVYKPGRANPPLCESQRRYVRKKAGYGSQPKPIFRKNAKINKKITPMYTCEKCGYKLVGKPLRQKKYEIQRM